VSEHEVWLVGFMIAMLVIGAATVTISLMWMEHRERMRKLELELELELETQPPTAGSEVPE
jgi:hypothetical protein